MSCHSEVQKTVAPQEGNYISSTQNDDLTQAFGS